MLIPDQRTYLHSWPITRANDEAFSLLLKILQHWLLRATNKNSDASCKTAFPCISKGRIENGRHCSFDIGIWHHDQVVFCTSSCLHAFAMTSGFLVDIASYRL